MQFAAKVLLLVVNVGMMEAAVRGAAPGIKLEAAALHADAAAVKGAGLPEHGFFGKPVAHDDMTSATSDFANEYGPKVAPAKTHYKAPADYKPETARVEKPEPKPVHSFGYRAACVSLGSLAALMLGTI